MVYSRRSQLVGSSLYTYPRHALLTLCSQAYAIFAESTMLNGKAVDAENARRSSVCEDSTGTLMFLRLRLPE
jgi:hypothetical protein